MATATAGRSPVWRRLGIGARITSIFVLGALALSFSMGGLSYFTTRHFLLAERESAAQHQAFANATLLRSSLSAGDTAYADLLASLDAGSGSHSVLIHKGTAYSSSLSLSASSIPGRLRDVVLGGSAATQTYRDGAQGQPQIAVGVPIPSVHGAYFEVFSLSDLDHTLRVLGLALIAAGIVTTLIGAALGRVASERSLRPLAGVSRAAVAIAGGQLDTRLKSDPVDSDLVGLTTSFNAMVDELQVRIEREARFNSDVSHELRSPLTTLSASLEVLEADRDGLPPRAQRALQLLGDDLRRFQRMIGDLLEMSRADAGSVDVFLEEVNVCELVQRAVDAGMRTLGEDGAGPQMVLGDGVQSLRVDVDKRRFERVMANLLENAAHYGGGATVVSVTNPASSNGAAGAGAGAGGGSGAVGAAGEAAAGGDGTDDSAVNLRSERSDRSERRERGAGRDGRDGPDGGDGTGPGQVEIGVEDDGPGVSPQERTKVFERFFRGPASGRRGTGTGTGLGLALVAEHVRLMHGEVRVEAAPSGGARFVIALPVAPTYEASDEAPDEAAP
jgi:signal transduction histidine kinase